MPKNKVIWIVLDSLRPDTFKRYNKGTLKKLKDDSIYFPNCVAQSTFTPTSFGSFLSSTNPYRSRTCLVNLSAEALRYKDKTKDSKEKEKEKNYIKGIKLEVIERPMIFDYFNRTFSCTKKILGNNYDYGSWNIHKEKDAAVSAEFIKENAQDGFFVFIRSIQTHIPWHNPLVSGQLFGGKYEYFKTLERMHLLYSNPITRPVAKRLFMFAAKMGLDLFVRRRLEGIISSLKECDIYDDTLIIISSDHGDNLHENYKAGPEHIGHGFDVEEGAINVPLLIKLPENKGGGSIVKEQVRNIDILPTILNVCNLDAKTELDGIPLLDSEGQVLTTGDEIAYSEATNMFSLKDSCSKLLVEFGKRGAKRTYVRGKKSKRLEDEADRIESEIRDVGGDEEKMIAQLKKLGYI